MVQLAVHPKSPMLYGWAVLSVALGAARTPAMGVNACYHVVHDHGIQGRDEDNEAIVPFPFTLSMHTVHSRTPSCPPEGTPPESVA